MANSAYYAEIEGGTVVAVRKYETDRKPEGAVMVTPNTGPASPGSTWGGETFTAPARAPRPRDEVLAQVKAEAQRRILAVFPFHHQLNTAGRGIEVLFDVVTTGREMTEAEQTELAAGLNAYGKIKAIRAASDAIEGMDPLPADITNDELWPA